MNTRTSTSPSRYPLSPSREPTLTGIPPPSPSGKPTTNEKELSTARPAQDAEFADGDGEVDAVWGKVDGSGKGSKFRNLGWKGATIIEVKLQVGLGILGLPLVMSELGIVVGVVVILVVSLMILWSNYVIGLFKRKYPECYSIADCGRVMAGPIGEGVVGFVYWLMMTAIAGSGLIGVSTALNAVSLHGTCTVVFVAVAAIICILLASIRTLDRVSWLGWVGMTSILAAVITLMAAVGSSDRPAQAPADGPINKIVNVIPHSDFVSALNAVSTTVFAFCATPAFMSIAGELRRPQDYNKSLIASQSAITILYLVVGGVVYHYVGQYIASPALGSAGPLLKRICYGLAIPGLCITCVLFTHLAAKMVYVRLMRRTGHLGTSSWQDLTAWFSCVFCNTAISFIIAESIPIFSDLLSLIGALLGTFLCVCLEAVMYIFMQWREDRRRWQWKAGIAANVVLFLLGGFVLVAGTYASAITINNSLNDGNTTSPFTCADNSHSV